MPFWKSENSVLENSLLQFLLKKKIVQFFQKYFIFHKIKEKHLNEKNDEIVVSLEEAKAVFNKIVAPKNLSHRMYENGQF